MQKTGRKFIMIQVVTYDGKDTRYDGDKIDQYSLHDIRSLDEYEIDVICRARIFGIPMAEL